MTLQWLYTRPLDICTFTAAVKLNRENLNIAPMHTVATTTEVCVVNTE